MVIDDFVVIHMAVIQDPQGEHVGEVLSACLDMSSVDLLYHCAKRVCLLMKLWLFDCT